MQETEGRTEVPTHGSTSVLKDPARKYWMACRSQIGLPMLYTTSLIHPASTNSTLLDGSRIIHSCRPLLIYKGT